MNNHFVTQTPKFIQYEQDYERNVRNAKKNHENKLFTEDMSLKVEKIVLSHILFMCDKKTIEKFLTNIPRYWFNLQYYPYYDAIKEVYEAEKFDSQYLIALLNNKYRISYDDIATLSAETPIVDIDNFYEILEQKYIIREQYNLAKKLYYATCEFKILNIEQEIQNHRLHNRESYNIKSFAQWAKFYKDNNINIEKYELGIPFLDKSLYGGIELGQLVLINGEYETGKTSLVLQILENLSKNHKTCLFSFEFPIHIHILKRQQLFKKMVANKQLTQKNVENIMNNMIIIDEGTEINEIESRIISLANEGVKFFAIDSQMCIHNDDLIGKGEQEESSKFIKLAKIAQKYNIVIILIVQTSKTDSTSPMGSKKGAYSASIMLRIENIIDNETKSINPHRKKIIFQKNKQTGNNDTYHVEFDRETRMFSNEELQVINQQKSNKMQNYRNNKVAINNIDNVEFVMPI